MDSWLMLFKRSGLTGGLVELLNVWKLNKLPSPRVKCFQDKHKWNEMCPLRTGLFSRLALSCLLSSPSSGLTTDQRTISPRMASTSSSTGLMKGHGIPWAGSSAAQWVSSFSWCCNCPCFTWRQSYLLPALIGWGGGAATLHFWLDPLQTLAVCRRNTRGALFFCCSRWSFSPLGYSPKLQTRVKHVWGLESTHDILGMYEAKTATEQRKRCRVAAIAIT